MTDFHRKLCPALFIAFSFLCLPAHGEETQKEKEKALIEQNPGQAILPPGKYIKDSAEFKKHKERIARAKQGSIEVVYYLPFKLTNKADLKLQLDSKLQSLSEDYKMARQMSVVDTRGLKVHVGAVNEALRAEYEKALKMLKEKKAANN